ncbi:hypothetical protein AALB51_20450 [Lachnospiraceae bacterium 62-26]
MTGKEVKKLLSDEKIHQWQVASQLNVSESTLIRWLRVDLSKEHEVAILEAIEQLKAQKD